MMNTPVHGEIVNDDLRTIDWVADGDIKLRPAGEPDFVSTSAA
ncbi:hypothetical protein DFI02_103120 [Rhizobium sp. PP-F2F-G20b]|nr:hypothetical protein C8J32_103300 [Rhizobium sp. PP-CC-3A-592]PYE43967.1 hypothetical protein DFI02_103120 [Rhizobium sp. PP-F2F-G20b]